MHMKQVSRIRSEGRPEHCLICGGETFISGGLQWFPESVLETQSQLFTAYCAVDGRVGVRLWLCTACGNSYLDVNLGKEGEDGDARSRGESA
jgi:hypothetical protein